MHKTPTSGEIISRQPCPQLFALILRTNERKIYSLLQKWLPFSSNLHLVLWIQRMLETFIVSLKNSKKISFPFSNQRFWKYFSYPNSETFQKNRGVSSFHSKKIDSSLHFSHQPNMYSQTETHNKNEKNPQYEKSLKITSFLKAFNFHLSSSSFPALYSHPNSTNSQKIKLNKRYKLEKKIASNWIILWIQTNY